MILQTLQLNRIEQSAYHVNIRIISDSPVVSSLGAVPRDPRRRNQAYSGGQRLVHPNDLYATPSSLCSNATMSMPFSKGGKAKRYRSAPQGLKSNDMNVEKET